MLYPNDLDKLIHELKKLPSVGTKMAVRMAFHLLSEDTDRAERLIEAISTARSGIVLCEVCFGISDSPTCAICRSADRDQNVITLVRYPQNVFHIEQTKIYKGLYHVLHGVISPLEGIFPEHLKIEPLVARIKKTGTTELIIALNTDLEGQATANYICELLADENVTVTRPGIGLPFGADIEHVDPETYAGALQSRTGL